jgi:DNA-binding CsgD family transcriptional regulator
MLHGEALKTVVDELLTAALLGDRWEETLARLAAAAGARGAVVSHNKGNRAVALMATGEAAGPASAFLAGLTPPSSRQNRVQPMLHGGFRVDHDDYTDDELGRDPFYQEFLRPNGFFWHANARLADGPDDCYADLSFKRAAAAGPYQRADVVVLDTILHDARVAARVTRRVVDAQASGVAQVLRKRGDAVFELDAWGRVLRSDAAAAEFEASPVRVLRRRLVATDPGAQADLDRAVARAVTPPRATAVAPLPGVDRRPFYLQLVPVTGRAHDVFLAAAAVGVLIEPGRRRHVDKAMFRHTFGLTDREVDVALLLEQGLDLATTARRVGIEIGTARNHLKRVFDKTDTSRQAELVALLARLRP